MFRAGTFAIQAAGAAVSRSSDKSTILFFSTLFPVVNPLGGSPIFLLLSHEYSSAARSVLARRIAINSFWLLAASFLIGTHILKFFGISIPVVQVGGGLLVASTGWAMLHQKFQDEKQGASRHPVDPADIFKNAFYPLTMPLTVGPGSISIAITLGANAPQHHGLDFLAIASGVVGSLLIASAFSSPMPEPSASQGSSANRA